MDQGIAIATAAVLALVVAYGTANAAAPGLLHTAAAVIASSAGLDIADQREVITPPSDLDRDMAITPPHSGGRMPIITPPETPGDRLAVQR
jgi:hypothetical protein